MNGNRWWWTFFNRFGILNEIDNYDKAYVNSLWCHLRWTWSVQAGWLLAAAVFHLHVLNCVSMDPGCEYAND